MTSEIERGCGNRHTEARAALRGERSQSQAAAGGGFDPVSCFVCGAATPQDDIAVRHLVHADVVCCKTCKRAIERAAEIAAPAHGCIVDPKEWYGGEVHEPSVREIVRLKRKRAAELSAQGEKP